VRILGDALAKAAEANLVFTVANIMVIASEQKRRTGPRSVRHHKRVTKLRNEQTSGLIRQRPTEDAKVCCFPSVMPWTSTTSAHSGSSKARGYGGENKHDILFKDGNS
jgi:hypothetical protein